MGAFPEPEPELSVSEIMLDTLRRTVGGEAALEALDADSLPDEPFAWDGVPDDVHDRVGEVLTLLDRCCAELLDGQYRTACQRLLADAAAGDPELFRRRSRPATAAAALCWIVGKVNSLFDDEPVTPKMQVTQLTAHFGTTGTAAAQRGNAFLRGIGAEPARHGWLELGTPRYLTGQRRAYILAERDRYRAMADQ